MSDLQIDQTTGPWDLALVDGDVVLIDTVSHAAEVAQRVVYRLMTWHGESPYDRRVGIPYLDGIFGFEPLPNVAALLTQTIVDTEGVTGLDGAPEYLLDDAVLTYSVAISVDDGSSITIETAVTP